jgi:hypothetical protein
LAGDVVDGADLVVAGTELAALWRVVLLEMERELSRYGAPCELLLGEEVVAFGMVERCWLCIHVV